MFDLILKLIVGNAVITALFGRMASDDMKAVKAMRAERIARCNAAYLRHQIKTGNVAR
jgi:hypothetical protein